MKFLEVPKLKCKETLSGNKCISKMSIKELVLLSHLEGTRVVTMKQCFGYLNNKF